MANHNATRESLMKANEAIALRTQERVEKFLTCVREKNGDYVTSTELAEKLGVVPKSIYNLVHNHIKGKYPEVESVSNKGYRWVGAEKKAEPTVVEPEVKKEPKTSYRNAEGYHDPTAAAVLEKLERNGKDRAGEIWSTSNDEVYFLILACSRGLAVGFTVCRMDEWYDPEYDMTVTLGNKGYYVNLRRLNSKPAKTLYANYGNIGKARLEYVRTAVTKYLGLPAVEVITEKPVEVIREKIVEKPVEVEKVIFKTKFDRKKLRKAHAKSYSDEKYDQLLAKSKKNQQFWTTQFAVEQARANAWEQAFRMMATGSVGDPGTCVKR